MQFPTFQFLNKEDATPDVGIYFAQFLNNDNIQRSINPFSSAISFHQYMNTSLKIKYRRLFMYSLFDVSYNISHKILF